MRGRPIPGLKKYQGCNPNGYFQDLDWPVRRRAYRWLGVFLKRWGRNLTSWRFPILVGQAKRLALNPPDSAWGRSMNARKGGYAVQHQYRAEGRHPTEKATHARLATLKVRNEAERRKRFGLPPQSARHGFTV